MSKAWQAIIEIGPTRSDNLKDVIRLAKRTATQVIEHPTHTELVYAADRTLDLSAMIERVRLWKSVSLFVNGHAVELLYYKMVLQCLNYGMDYGVKHDNLLCQLCPAYDGCNKIIGKKINDVFKGKSGGLKLHIDKDGIS